MSKKMSFILFLLLLFLLLIPQFGQAQYLVKLNSENPSLIKNNSNDWYYELRGNHFATVTDLPELDNNNIEYVILDEDIETEKYYWVGTKFDLDMDVNDITQIENVNIVWYDQKTVLTNIKNVNLFKKNLDRKYFVKRVNFNSITYQQSRTLSSDNVLQKVYMNNTIQSILDSVNINEMYLTEEHISGERSYMLNGQPDSIQTRYSYSPQISKAKNYLQSRFEEYGYSVEYLPFALETFYDIQFLNALPGYGWVITTDKIFGTIDSGLSWTVQYEGNTGATLWSVFPYDQNTAYVVGEYGTILKTTDGSTWQQPSSPTNSFLFGIHFRNSSLGWICGDTGIILKTTNGGSNWTTKSTPTSNRLYDIFFINDSTGWAVGRSGTIIFTNNYGENWTLQSTPTSSRLYGVHFKNENEGFVVGWDGVVLKTTTGGVNWTTVTVPVNNRFYDIDFIDQNTGMIVGWDGTCMTTIDGGTTWTSAGNIYQQDIYGFDLINSSDAWAAGTAMVASSSNFGANWIARLDSIPSGSLINLVATKTGTLYPDKHYIICAHYDDTSNNPMVRAPGADDNGSGTTAVIEAARVLADYTFNYSIKFILFPGEEQGLWGSEAYAANAAATGEQIQGVINMDMIGYDGNNNGSVEIHAGTMPASQTIGSFMVTNASTFGLALTPEYKTFSSSTASDHSSFWDYGFPAIMHIEDFQDFTPYYHTTNDLLSTINLPYFLDNAKLSIGSLALLAEVDTAVNSIAENQLPSDFVLQDPYPNPFNPEVNIKYSLQREKNISIDIFDILGKHILNIGNGLQKTGDYHLKWNGINKHSEFVASGIYLLRVKIEGSTAVKKLVLMR